MLRDHLEDQTKLIIYLIAASLCSFLAVLAGSVCCLLLVGKEQCNNEDEKYLVRRGWRCGWWELARQDQVGIIS